MGPAPSSAIPPAASALRVRVLSAATADHFNSLRCMVSTLATTDPSTEVLVFALDESVTSRTDSLRAANPRLNVQPVNWSALPAFARVRPALRAKRDESLRAGHYAWKPLLIAREAESREARRRDATVWLDAEHRLRRRGVVGELVRRARAAGGVFSTRSAGTAAQWTHEGMIGRMYNRSAAAAAPSRAVLGRTRPARLAAWPNCDASTLALVHGSSAARELLEAWSACARDLSCIAPEGSSRANHRQDQAALTLLLQDRAMRMRTPSPVCSTAASSLGIDKWFGRQLAPLPAACATPCDCRAAPPPRHAPAPPSRRGARQLQAAPPRRAAAECVRSPAHARRYDAEGRAVPPPPPPPPAGSGALLEAYPPRACNLTCDRLVSAVVLQPVSPEGLHDRITVFAALANLAHSLCAHFVAPPPCRLLRASHNFNRPVGCDVPWSRYLGLAYQFPREGEPHAPIPLPAARWRRPAGAAVIEEANDEAGAQYAAAARYAALGEPFEWRIRRPLSAFSKGFEALQTSARPAGCSHWPPRVSASSRGAAKACNFVTGEKAHSATALRWARAFLSAQGLGVAFGAVHVRTQASTCNDSIPSLVSAHVKRQLPDSRMPIVFFSNSGRPSYLSEIKRMLYPRRVVFADAVLRQMDAELREDNYLVFATERAIASKAERAFQIGYKPCGRVINGWAGTWHP